MTLFCCCKQYDHACVALQYRSLKFKIYSLIHCYQIMSNTITFTYMHECVVDVLVWGGLRIPKLEDNTND